MKNDYYVYEHREADTGRTFYVGKGNRKRAWRKDSRNPHWRNIVRAHGFKVVFLHENLSPVEASALEMAVIAAYGRENLCNLTDGGGGSWGYSHGPETRAKMSKAKAGMPRGPATDETREKIRLKAVGRSHTDEAKKKMRIAKLGRTLPESHKAKISATLKKNWRYVAPSPEAQERKSKAAIERGADITLVHPIHGTITAKHHVFLTEYGMDGGHLSRLRAGKLKTHKGWSTP